MAWQRGPRKPRELSRRPGRGPHPGSALLAGGTMLPPSCMKSCAPITPPRPPHRRWPAWSRRGCWTMPATPFSRRAACSGRAKAGWQPPWPLRGKGLTDEQIDAALERPMPPGRTRTPSWRPPVPWWRGRTGPSWPRAAGLVAAALARRGFPPPGDPAGAGRGRRGMKQERRATT